MHVDKYKQPDEGYLDPDGCWHEDAEDVIRIGILKQCGCGNGWASMTYIRDILRLIRGRDGSDEGYKRCDDFFHSEGEKYTMYYLLDDLGLTDHGTSVPGWLSEKGVEVLEDLEELLKEDESGEAES